MVERRSALPAVVWDMGGILYRYFTEILLDWGTAHGWDINGITLGPTGPAADAAYEAMQSGEIDEREYLAVVRERLATIGIEVDPVAAIDWSRESRRAAWRVVQAVYDAGHPQALVTNDGSKWLGDRWWETWPAVGWFAALVDVAVVGVRKPAPEPYLAAAEALDLDAGDCLFVDDVAVNCEGAEAVGMPSHHVDIRDPEAAMEALAARLGVNADCSTPDRALQPDAEEISPIGDKGD